MMPGDSASFQAGRPSESMRSETMDEDSQALMREAEAWMDKSKKDDSMDQLPKAKSRRIQVDPTKKSTLEMDDAIAIVGVGGKFPGADTIDDFWQVLVKGENHVIEIPPERWNVEEYYSKDYDEPGKTYVRRAGFLQNFDEFDPKMFGISEPEAAKMDPQQRYVLDCVHMALEDGGILRKDLDGSRTGVYIGVMNDDYKSSATEDPSVASNYTLTGTAPSIIAARISYVYNLLGPSLSIDTACSSSLVAIHLASQALKSGDCSMAICGGVNSILYPDIFIPLSKARMVSPTGQCQAFADTADGYIRGEGSGVIVLKKLKDAIRDGNKIWATIATGCNQDGRTMTPITAPSVQMQTELLQEVYESNNLHPSLVQYIEAHGTGTPVGDPIEANSLGEFFKQYRDGIPRPIKIGSVKTNIGHLESAAGVAGIVKVLLMMKNGKTVKSLHFKRPNPKIDFQKYNMAVTTEVDEWPTMEDGTRVSCVNSFGFGGTNSHAIIKQFPVNNASEVENDIHRKYIVFLSALDNGGLTNSLKYFVKNLETSSDSLRSIAFTSSCRREHFKYRLGLVAETKEELSRKANIRLRTVSEVRPPGLNPPNIVFVFCGVGTTWTGMCTELLKREPVFFEAVKEVDSILRKYTEWSILEKIQMSADLSDPLVGHLAIFTCQIGLARLWKHFGIEPNAIVGQSVGEVAAAHVSGVLSLEDAIKVIYYRSAILSKATGGSMFVVGNSDVPMVEEMCQSYGDRINVAVYNSDKSATVSGDTDVVNEVMQKLKQKSDEEQSLIFLRTLNVKCAYHSRYTEKASVELENVLDGLQFNEPKTKLISTVTGEESVPTQFGSPQYWRDNVRKPVRFQKAVLTSSVNHALNIFVEIGPKPVLKAHLSANFEEGKATSIPSMNVNSEMDCMYAAIADIYEAGITPSMEKINPYSSIISDIPKYIPNKIKALFEADATKLRKQGRTRLASAHPFMKRQSDDETPYKIDISTTSTPYVYEHNVAGNILVPGAFYAEVALEASRNILEQSPFDLEISVEFLRPLRLSPGNPCEAFFARKSLDPLKNMSFIVRTGNDITAKGTSSIITEDNRLSMVDLNKIRDRCPIYHPKEKTYDTLKNLGFTYGADLQILGNGYKNRTECLVEVTLSDVLVNDLTSTSLHPAILDGLLQTPGIVQDLMEEAPSGQLLPAGFGKLILRRSPEKSMLAYMNQTSYSKDEITYNLLLLQTDGIVIAEVKDFVIRSVEKSEKTGGQLAHKIIWTELKTSRRRKRESKEKKHTENESESVFEEDAKDEKILDKKSEDHTFVVKANVETSKEELDKDSIGSSSESEKKDSEKETSSISSLESDEKDRERSFIFIARDKETMLSFKENVHKDIEIAYHVAHDAADVQEEVLEKYFGSGASVNNKELCIIFATGQMKNNYHSNPSILDDLVNECDILMNILQFFADKVDPIPIYILTQSTQPVDVEGQMNLVGSELWGIARSVLREHSFKLYLIDIDPNFKSCMEEIFAIVNGKNLQLILPELAIRQGKIYQSEFITQPDSERLQIPKINSVDKYCTAEYRSKMPDKLHDTFYSLQEMDDGDQRGYVKIAPTKACLHDETVYPLTFEKAVDALDLWPQAYEDGYGVLTFEVIGKKIEKKSKKDRKKNKNLPKDKTECGDKKEEKSKKKMEKSEQKSQNKQAKHEKKEEKDVHKKMDKDKNRESKMAEKDTCKNEKFITEENEELPMVQDGCEKLVERSDRKLEKKLEKEKKHAEKEKKHTEKQEEREKKHAEKEKTHTEKQEAKEKKQAEKERKHAEKQEEKEIKHGEKREEKEKKHDQKETKHVEKQEEKENKHVEKQQRKEKKHEEKEKKHADKIEVKDEKLAEKLQAWDKKTAEMEKEEKIEKRVLKKTEKEKKREQKEKERSEEQYVACYPMKVQSVVSVPKSCIVNLSDIPSYVPGMLRATCLLWELAKKLPTRKRCTILADDESYLSALILKQLITTRRSGQAMILKMDEVVSIEQITDVVIPLTKLDLQTCHGLLESASHLQTIASLRHFIALPVERYITARSPHVKVATVEMDHVLARTHLPQIVPSVIKWLKKQKGFLNQKDAKPIENAAAVYGLPSRVMEVVTNTSGCEIRIPDNLIFRKTAVYIIVGGLTGLGWELVKYLAEKGAGFIISLSRREPSSERQQDIQELSVIFDCSISSVQTDITNLSSLQNTFDIIAHEIPYPIKGIFQGAGVLDDALFVSMTKEKFQKVLMPKVLGSWNLHIVSQKLPLDFFVMHSSMTSVFGNAGQTNYGAANAFMDTLAHYRRNLGLAGQSINWGPLKVGMAVDNNSLEEILQRRGFYSLTIAAIRKCLIEILKNNCQQVTYGLFDWEIIATGLEAEEMFLVRHRFRGLVDKILKQKQEKRNAVQMNFNLDDMMALPREERIAAIVKALIALASEVFGVEHSLLSDDTLISSLGVDSMLAMTFAQTVLKVMHVKISLVMLLTDGTTIQSLAESVNVTLETGEVEEVSEQEIDPLSHNALTQFEKPMYDAYLRNSHDPSLYMFGDITVKNVVAKPEYWKPLIMKIHKKYPVLRTLFVPGHDDVRYGVKRVILDPEEIEIDFRIVEASMLLHKTRIPPNNEVYLFDPAKDLPLRVFYAKKGRGAIIRFLFNHLALDLSSVSMMMNDLHPSCPEPELSEPIDVSFEIESMLRGYEKKLKNYWKSVIPGDVLPMSLSKSGDTTTDPDYFECTRIQIPDKLVKELKTFLKSNRCTMFQLLTTLYEILLHVELCQSTISIITTVDCRMFFPKLQNEANRLSNRIPLFLQLQDSSVQVAEILQRNKLQIMESMEHAQLPYPEIIEEVKGHPASEVFRHQIIMEETSKLSSIVIKDGKRSPIKVKKLQTSNFYNETILYVWSDEKMKTLELELGCSTLLIEEDRANNFLSFMLMMMERLIANPGLTLAEMTSYNMEVSPLDDDIDDDARMNVFTKQTSKGWEHKVYLDAASDTSCLKWGTCPEKMSKSIAYRDIKNIKMVEMDDKKAIVLEMKSRNHVFKTASKNCAMQWWLTIRDKMGGKRGNESTDL